MSNDASSGAPRTRYMSSRKSSTCWFTWCRTATASSARTISSRQSGAAETLKFDLTRAASTPTANAVGDSGAEKISEVTSGEWGMGGKPVTTEAVKELAAGRHAA